MNILHIIILPAIALCIGLFSEDFFDREDFFHYIKLFIVGSLFMIIFRFLTGFFDNFFYGNFYPANVIIKTFLYDGVLFFALSLSVFYLFTEFFSSGNASLTFKSATYYLFSFLCGMFFIMSFTQNSRGETPDSPLYYLIFIPLLIILSITAGYGVSKYNDEYTTSAKIIWGTGTVAAISLIVTLFQCFTTYNLIICLPIFTVAAAGLGFFYYKSELE